MPRRKAHRFLASLAFCSIVLILAALFCVIYISVYEANNPRMHQTDIDASYKKGYSDGYRAGYEQYQKIANHSSVDKNASYWEAYEEGYNSSYEYVGLFDESAIIGLAEGIVAWQHDHPDATAIPTSSTPNHPNSTSYPTSTPIPLYRGEYPYVGNRHSWIFHYPNCPYVDLIDDEYKVAIDSRAEAIEDDYTPCLICKP